MPNYLKDNYTATEVNSLLIDENWPQSAFSIDSTGANTILLLGTVGINGGQNNTFIDSSPNRYTVTRNGDASQGTLSPYSLVGWSGYFDGSGDYLTIPDNTAIQVGSSDFTFEAWVYPLSLPSAGNYKTLWAKRANSAGFGGACLVLDPSGNFLFFVASSASAWGLSGSLTGHTVSTNTWQHLAMVRSGNTLILYKNGIAGTTVTLNFTVYDGTSSLSLMSGGADGTQAVDGYMSNFRLVKGTAVYNGNFTLPTLPLNNYGSTIQYSSIANVNTTFASSNTSLLGLRRERFIDESINNFTLTIAGDTKITPFSPFKNGLAIFSNSYSGYFDGTGYLTLPTSINSAMGGGIAGGLQTFEGWLYPTSWTAANSYDTAVYGNYQSIAANGRWAIWVRGQTSNGNGKLKFLYTTGTGTQDDTVISANANIPLNTWTHFAITIDPTTNTNTTIKFFINGILTDTFTGKNLSTQTTNYGTIYLGANQAYSNGWKGYISNFRHCYNKLVYTGNFIVPVTSLSSKGIELSYSSTSNIDITLSLANVTLMTLQDNIIKDNSANNFSITTGGNVILTSQNPFGETIDYNTSYSIYNSGSLQLDGSGDGINLSAPDGLALGTSDFTIELWIYLNSISASAIILDFRPTSVNGVYPCLYFDSTTASYRYYVSTADRITGANNTTKKNTWQHIAIVRETSVTKLFVDGVQIGASYSDTNNYLVGASRPTLGISGNTGADAVNGMISNFRIIRNTAIYRHNFVPPIMPVGISGNTQVLLNFNNASIYDKTTRNNILTIGNAQKSTNIYKFPGAERGSIYFDGTGDYLTIPSHPNFVFGIGDFTVEFWINLSSNLDNYDKIIQMGTTGNSFTIETQTTLNTLTVTNYTSTVYLTSSSALTLNQWIHIAATRSSGTLKLFQNGIQVGSVANTTDFSNGVIYIGASSTGQAMNGYIDNLRLTKGYARYTANFTPPVESFNA